MIEFVVTQKQSGHLLRNILRSEFQVSRRLMTKLLNTNGITKNGNPAHLNHPVQQGDIIKIMFPKEVSEFHSESMDLDIRYEDDEILVVNKPPGMLVHPSAKEREGALLSGVAAYLAPYGLVPHAVHRLDRDTSGVVMFAKHAHAHHLFDVVLRRGRMHRGYCAFVHLADQNLQDKSWQTITLPIGQDPRQPSRRIISADGQRAITHVRIVARVGEVGVAQVILETGRTHQIRLHLASVGMPIIGEPHYTWDYNMNPMPVRVDVLLSQFTNLTSVMQRQALHAYRLEWQHPVSKQSQVAFAPLASDMREFLKARGMTPNVWETITDALAQAELPTL